jgi:hypothetical protein
MVESTRVVHRPGGIDLVLGWSHPAAAERCRDSCDFFRNQPARRGMTCACHRVLTDREAGEPTNLTPSAVVKSSFLLKPRSLHFPLHKLLIVAAMAVR